MRVLSIILVAVLGAGVTLGLTACGGADPGVDKDSIRRNADDADRDLDRESQKHREDQ